MKKQTIGERIKLLRDEYRLSQADFGSEIGTTGLTVGNYERGVSKEPQREVLNKIVARFGTTHEWIMEGKGEMLPDGKKEKTVSVSENPYKDYAIQRLEREVEKQEQEAQTWRQKYEQAWSRLEFFMDRLPLGKRKAGKETASDAFAA